MVVVDGVIRILRIVKLDKAESILQGHFTDAAIVTEEVLKISLSNVS